MSTGSHQFFRPGGIVLHVFVAEGRNFQTQSQRLFDFDLFHEGDVFEEVGVELLEEGEVSGVVLF